ncbi:hypothetical protein C8J56DRAFT_723489, partial [Mycena floridula]
DNRHRPNKNCRCTNCEQARYSGCQNPHKCFRRAKLLLDCIPPRWNPTSGNPEEAIQPPTEHEHNDERQYFDSSNMICKGTLKETFRIFTE